MPISGARTLLGLPFIATFGHEALVAGNPNRHLAVATGSNHDIPGSEPDVILQAVERMSGLIASEPRMEPT